MADEFSVRVTMNSQPTFLGFLPMSILSKQCNPDNFEPHNSLKLTFTNILGLHSYFVESESFLESNSPNILTQCETNFDDSIDSGNLPVRGYLPLIQNDSITHMHDLAVYVKDFCTRLISSKLCEFLLMFLTVLTPLSASLLLPLLITFFGIMVCS